MKISRFCIFIILIFSVCSSKAQSISQFNGQFLIQKIESLGSDEYQIRGVFSDQSSVFQATDVLPADRIIDGGGKMFQIISLTTEGSIINALSKGMDGAAPTIGDGLIYRPSNKGFPLITSNAGAAILTSANNTATLSIDYSIPNYGSGTALPAASAKLGEVVLLSGNSKIYKMESGGWKMVTNIPFVFALPENAVKGDVVYNALDDKNYTYDGSAWILPKVLAALPAQSKYGDVFYDTSQQKLFMFDANNKWANISGASIPGGPGTEFPGNTKPGDLYFNTDNNALYVLDNSKKWLEISANGSTPSGATNPDPSAVNVKEGNLFYNTSEHKLYVYNGTTWLPLDLTLRSGQIFMGNSSNIASGVTVSGDATLSSAGRLIIKDHAVTEEKLDKVNIPLSGFAIPTDDIALGDGISNFKITNLKDPTKDSDAATMGYVNALITKPGILALPLNYFFIGNSSNKAVPTAKNLIPLSGFDRAYANISMGTGTTGPNFKIINLADPSLAQDAATKNYVDSRVLAPGNLSLPKGNMFVGNDISTAEAVAKNTIPLSEFGAAAAHVSMGNFKITALADPVADQEAATKNYVDKKVISPASITLTKGNLFVGDAAGKAADVSKNTIALSGFGAASADVSMGGFVLSNLGIPLVDGDASTKKYVDDLFKTPASHLALPTGNFFVGNAAGNAEATAKKLIPVSGFAKATDNIYMGDATTQFGISFLKYPMLASDAATKGYVDDQLAMPGSLILPTDHILVGDAANKAVPVAKNAVPLSDFGIATADISLGNGTKNYKITNLADPQTDQEAATKKYVDAKSSKTPVGPTAPDKPVAGDTYYNTADNRLYVYNGKDWVPVDNKLKETELYVGDAKGIAVSTPKNTIPLSGFDNAKANISIGDGTTNFKLINLADPENDQEAATKKYVDSKSSKTPTGPTAPGKAVAGDTYYNTADNRLYVYDGIKWVPLDNKLADRELYVGNSAGIAVSTPKKSVPISGFGSAEGDVSMGNFKITNLDDPKNDQEAATKKYVDAGLLTAGANAKDNLGNHKATESIKLSVYAISNDGADGKGLTFDTQGNASFGQDVTINGNLYTPSDRRLKINIETLSHVLQKIDQLRGVKFEYKDQHKYASGHKIGVIAQELQKVYPEMVTKGKDGFLKVDYTQLTGMLIQAVREQQKQIAELQIRMNNQQEQINSILKKIQ